MSTCPGSAASAPPASAATAILPVRVDAEVVRNQSEGGSNWRLVLRVETWPGFAPGQFVMLSAGARTAVVRNDPLLPRPMAVYRTHGAGGSGLTELEILYKVSGRGTALLSEALAGQSVRVVGPLGRAFPSPPAGVPALLVGGGTGIASLYELAHRLQDGHRVGVLLGARIASDLMGERDFEELGVELERATEDGSKGHHGRVTEVLETKLAEDPEAWVHACGPTPMMRRCAEIAAEHGARCLVSLENHMACGFGVCLGCAAPRSSGGYALVCKEGPVFDAVDVHWETLP